jgi:hypothetical protein
VSEVMRSYLRLEWNKEKIIFEVAHKDITDSCGIGACIDLQKFSGLRLVELTAAPGLLKQDLSRTPPRYSCLYREHNRQQFKYSHF